METVLDTYRVRPGAGAERALLAGWHRCRFLWNEAVHQRRTGRKPTLCGLAKLLTEAWGRSAWLREGSQVAQRQTLRTCSQSLSHSSKVKGRGRAKLKARRRALPPLDYTVRGFSTRERRLRLPAGASIPVVWSRPLPWVPTSVRVYRDSLGYWSASFVVRREVEPAAQAEGSIGIGWGVSTTATTTDPAYDLPYLGHRRMCAGELARAQPKMSRLRKPCGHTASNGYNRARRQAARSHQRAANQNRHAGGIWAKSVVDNHQSIAVEGSKPKLLARSTMARKSADAGIGAAKRELVERGTRERRTVVLVPPAHTTMTCSGCASTDRTCLGLGMGTFRCEARGLEAGRDWNAARTILATAGRTSAGVDDVRHLLPPLGM